LLLLNSILLLIWNVIDTTSANALLFIILRIWLIMRVSILLLLLVEASLGPWLSSLELLHVDCFLEFLLWIGRIWCNLLHKVTSLHTHHHWGLGLLLSE
jgi:hypothetical protein